MNADTGDQPTLKGPASRPTVPAAPPEVGAAEPSARFAKFVRVARLGSGGMGEVWKAWDTELQRWVALKFLKGDDGDEVVRFKREAQTAGRLNHPNVAAVYDVGEAQGRHYIAMQFVDGQTLRAVPRVDRRLLVRLVRDAARAVAFANAQGIVHRDLKPDNVMVTGAESHVYVMDFGLARAVEGDSRLSVSGAVVGTPSYMPPEQARGQRADARADVYGLGATLYELLTDRVPFHRGNAFETLLAVVEEDVKPPRRVDPAIDADLETIVLKCLEKERERRYASVAELAADLDRWLEGEPIAARRASIWYAVRKRLVKRRALAFTALAGVALAAAVAGVVVPRWRSETTAREQRERELAEERERGEALKELGTLWMQIVLARQGFAVAANDPAEVQERLTAAVAAVTPFVERHRGRAQGFYVRALGRYHLSDFEGAEADARESLRLEAGFAPGRALLARILMEQYLNALGDGTRKGRGEREVRAKPILDEALRILREPGGTAADWGLPRTPEDDEMRVVVEAMGAMWNLNDVEAGRAILLREDAARPSAEYAYWLGRWTLDAGEERIRLDEALRRMPHFVRALNARGQARAAARDYPGAIADFTRVLQIQPRNERAWLNRGVSRLESKDVEGALADYGRAIELGPEREVNWSNRSAARMEIGDADGALADADQAIRLNPKSSAAHTNRANALVLRGDLPAALESADRAVALGGGANDYNSRGGIKDRMGDHRGAEADITRAIELEPSFATAWRNRAMVRRSLGNSQGALDDIDEAIRLKPGVAEIHAGRAAILFGLGDHSGAGASAAAALKLDDGCAEAYVVRGGIALRTGNAAGAEADFSKALELEPARDDAFLNRGSARVALGKHRAALEDLDRFLKGKPRNAEALRLRASVHATMRDFRAAIEDFTRAIDVAPDVPWGWSGRGLARHDTGDSRGAEQDCTKAIELDERHYRGWYNRGLARLALGNLEGSEADFTRAIDLFPKEAEAYLNRGAARHKAGRARLAIADYTRAIELQPTAGAFSNRGLARKQTGDFRGAIEDFSEALKREPERLELRMEVADLKCDTGDYGGAIEECTEVLKRSPQSVEAFNTRSLSAFKLGRWKAAIDDASEAIRLAPKDPLGYVNRGGARAGSDDYRGALADFEKALEIAPADWGARAAIEESVKAIREHLKEK